MALVEEPQQPRSSNDDEREGPDAFQIFIHDSLLVR
jgi:hypothetical protein